LLIEVDYISSKKALVPSQTYSPYELGFGKMVHLDKENFVGKTALARQQKHGVPRQLVGLEMDWVEIEERYEKFGLTPAAPSQASRAHVPVYHGQSHHNLLVADIEEDDRAGERRNSLCYAGNKVADGDHH
jgi:glycine cleavage system aminomethyltransferase T